MRTVLLCLLALWLCLTLTAQRPIFDPFQPSGEAAVRSHCIAVGSILASEYRVELMWNVKQIVRPNCEIMAGIPGTDHRSYSGLTLPSWASPVQIAGMINAEIDAKAHPGIVRRLGRIIRNVFTSGNPAIKVKGPLGLYEVDQFSAVKQT